MGKDLSNKFDASAIRIEISAPDKWREFLFQQGAIAAMETGISGKALLSVGTVRLACHWAALMEEEINRGRAIHQIAWDTFLKADDIVGGVTGSMAKAATAGLGSAWKHGADLVAWHNREAEKPGTAPGMVGKIAPPVVTVEEGMREMSPNTQVLPSGKR